MQVQTQIPFWSFHLGDLIVLLGIVIAALTYLSDRGRQSDERRETREKMVEEQTRMHEENKQAFAENRRRLDQLEESREDHEKVNRKRDEQISLLSQQTATLTEMARGMNRRLEMLEDRSS